MELKPEDLNSMDPVQEKAFWNGFEWALDNDQGEAAKADLAAGYPIYYSIPDYPEHVVKEYPDGRKELVDFDMKTGEESLIRAL